MNHCLRGLLLTALIPLVACDGTGTSRLAKWRNPGGGERDGQERPESPGDAREASRAALDARGMARAGFRRYGVRSGVVRYEITGSMRGVEVLLFDNWGLREAKYTRTEMRSLGGDRESHELTIIDGDSITTVDLEKGVGVRAPNPLLGRLAQIAAGKDMEDVGEALLRQMQGRKIGRDTVAGRPCDIWELPRLGGKIWAWRGVPLLTEITSPRATTLHRATLVETGVDIPDERFAIPDGVKLEEARG